MLLTNHETPSMVPNPIPDCDRNLDRPTPTIDLIPRDFRAYARLAGWDETTIDLKLGTPMPKGERFNCGGRSVKILEMRC